MVAVEIPDNPNCAAVELRVFHELESSRPVSQVRLERRAGEPAWCDVTGWTTSGTPCPALIQKIDDSGEGVAWLVFGGDAGLRFQPAGGGGPWRLDDPRQWGEPFVVLTELGDVRAEGAQARHG